jgi:hypothetical protein
MAALILFSPVRLRLNDDPCHTPPRQVPHQALAKQIPGHLDGIPSIKRAGKLVFLGHEIIVLHFELAADRWQQRGLPKSISCRPLLAVFQ